MFRAVAILLSLSCVLICLYGAAMWRQMASLYEIAERIEEGEVLPSDIVETYEDRFPWAQADVDCLPDHKRAAVSFRLYALDMRLQQLDAGTLEQVEDADQAFENAVGSLDALLACVPTDGNAWLRLALVLAEIEGPGDETLNALQRSQWFAPHEAWIARVRARFAARLVGVGVQDVRALEVLDADATALARAGRIGDLERLIARGGPDAEDALNRALRLVEKDRRDLIMPVLEREEESEGS